jgi:hypothetical protein
MEPMGWEWGIVGIFGLLAVAALAMWVWALVDAIRVPDDTQYRSGTKLIWVLVIVLAQWVGAVIYLLAGRPDGGASKAIDDWNARRPPMWPGTPTGPVPPPPPPPPATTA